MPTIEEEIAQLIEGLRKRLGGRKTSDFIANLQYDVLTAHTSIEKILEERIYLQLEIEIPRSKAITWRAIRLWATPFMTSLSFVNKLDLVKDYKDISDKTYQKIRKLNTYRNEFAHLGVDELAEKYNQNSDESKNHLISILKTLNDNLNQAEEYKKQSNTSIGNQQKIVSDSRTGIEERVVDRKNYRKLDKNSILKRITLLRDPKHKDALGDFVLSKELYIEVDAEGIPINPLIKDFLLKLPGWEELIKLTDISD